MPDLSPTEHALLEYTRYDVDLYPKSQPKRRSSLRHSNRANKARQATRKPTEVMAIRRVMHTSSSDGWY